MKKHWITRIALLLLPGGLVWVTGLWLGEKWLRIKAEQRAAAFQDYADSCARTEARQSRRARNDARYLRAVAQALLEDK